MKWGRHNRRVAGAGVMLYVALTTASWAAPSVEQLSTSLVAVTSADTLSFVNGGRELSVGSQITLISPDGRQLTLTRGNTATSDSLSKVVFSLDGSGVANSGDWSSTGDLSGAPADGTWQVLASGGATHTGENGFPSVVLAVGAQMLDIAVASASPDTLYTLWNAHIGSSTYRNYQLGRTRPETYYTDSHHNLTSSRFFNNALATVADFVPDGDGDGYPDAVEGAAGSDASDPLNTPLEIIDADGDLVANVLDDDIDGDGVPNALDSDRDGDGYNNDDDSFPEDKTEWSDIDGDGIGDGIDPDRDGDNQLNLVDTSPDDLGAACPDESNLVPSL